MAAALDCCHSGTLTTLLIDNDYLQDLVPKKLLCMTCVFLLSPDLCLHIYKSARVCESVCV